MIRLLRRYGHAIGAGNPANGDGTNSGAVGAARPSDQDQLGRFGMKLALPDPCGRSAVYASVEQLLAAYERAAAEAAKPDAPSAPRWAVPPPPPKPRKLDYREQQELAGMMAGHVALAEAGRALDLAKEEVERLRARWQELEARRGPA